MMNIAVNHRELFTRVTHYYIEPHRFYHNADHIIEMFTAAEQFGLDLLMSQQLAILFHDIVYVPGCKGNEVNSVRLLKILARDEFSQQVIDKASQIIMDTVDHKPTCVESELVLDLDMMRLGCDYEVFLAHGDLIRKEFAYLTNEEWKAGRHKFFDAMTYENGFIFATDLFRDKFGFELQARDNMITWMDDNKVEE